MRLKYFALTMLLTLAGAVAPALSHADSIGLSAQDGTNYTYDFYAPDGTVNLAAGDTLTLTGLTDVTGVTLSQYAANAGTVTWDSTSVTYTLSQNQSYSAGSPIDLQLFTLSSSDSNMGALTYTLQESSGTQTGTIPQTVAQTPEPRSLILMATGAVVLFGLVRRRRAQHVGMPANLTPAI